MKILVTIHRNDIYAGSPDLSATRPLKKQDFAYEYVCHAYSQEQYERAKSEVGYNNVFIIPNYNILPENLNSLNFKSNSYLSNAGEFIVARNRSLTQEQQQQQQQQQLQTALPSSVHCSLFEKPKSTTDDSVLNATEKSRRITNI